MKKTFGLLTLSLTLALTFGTQTFAASSNSNELKNIKINYEKDLGHKNLTKDQIVDNLISDGLSPDDAEYYAKLDIMTNQLEKKNIQVNLQDGEEYSDEYVKVNKKELRDKALKLDKKALKAVLSKNKASNQGAEDLNNVLELMEKKYKNNKNSENRTIELKYNDGSSLVFETSTIKEKEEATEVKPQATNTFLGGPWNKDTYVDAINDVDNTGGTYTSTTTWKYVSGTHYAKVTDVLRWRHNGKNSLKIDYLSDEGASAYAGIVSISFEYLSNHKTGSVPDWGNIIQGYTDVIFKVSGSFAATFKYISISVDAGAAWHQYAITEAIRFPDTKEGSYGVYNYAGQFR